MSTQLHAPATLPFGKKTPVPTKQEACWAPDQVSAFTNEENLLALPQTESCIIQPIA
jgi:hypothetical protein